MTNAWFIILPLAILLWLVLAFLTPLPKDGRLPVAAAMALGLAGYSWQGMPDVPGAPVEKTVKMDGFGEVIEAPLAGMTDRYGAPARIIALADAFTRQGNMSNAARLLYGGTLRYPDNADLWVAYGNALAEASEGVMTPAAVMAFEQARTLDPAHPGPQLFLGLARAQKEDWAGARTEWQGLLDRSPANAPWREDLVARLKMLDMAEAKDRGAQPAEGAQPVENTTEATAGSATEQE